MTGDTFGCDYRELLVDECVVGLVGSLGRAEELLGLTPVPSS